MMDKPTKSKMNEQLIKQLRNLKDKRNALIASDLPVPTPQTVMFPIPAVLIKQQEPDVCQFMAKAGLINRNKDLGLTVKIEAGEPIDLTDGTTTAVSEVIFEVTDDTDIDAVEAFLAE